MSVLGNLSYCNAFWGAKKPQKMHGWPLLGYIYFHPSASCVSGSPPLF